MSDSDAPNLTETPDAEAADREARALVASLAAARSRPLSPTARRIVAICEYLYRPSLRLYGLTVFLMICAAGAIGIAVASPAGVSPGARIALSAILFAVAFISARASVRRLDRKLSEKSKDEKLTGGR